MIKIQWLASIWRQNEKNDKFHRKTLKTTQNYESDQIIMNCINLTSKRAKIDELRRKTFKTKQNYESDQIIMNCIDLTSKRPKMLSYVANIQNNAKLQKWSKYNDLHRFDVKTIKET